MQKSSSKKRVVKKQSQETQPGIESEMDPLPQFDDHEKGSGKLKGKKCLITGGDSGIGRAVAVAFAKQGAEVAILHLSSEKKDAEDTIKYIEEHYNVTCISLVVDISKEKNCKKAVELVAKKFKQIDVLVNNAAVQYPQKDISLISEKQLVETFGVNIFSMFYMVKAALPFMQKGSNIINTTSVTAYRGSGGLLDYSSTKGAIVSFTRSLSSNLMDKKIRVNGVSPGPIWTPLIPASFGAKHVETFGSDTPMERPGQPCEVAPAYVFLASADASYISGQIIHVNGGEIVNA
jgi:NAD(P)-dependent dehydrogenase (short-subunit alcohol dehydrogenase family)